MRALFLIFLTGVTCCRGSVLPGDDFNADTSAAVSALQQWYNSGGLWNSAGWWNAANCVDALEFDIIANNDTNYLATLQNTFNLNSGGNFLDAYYDDNGWWAEAWIRAYDLTGNTAYLNTAKTIFANMTNGWDSHCGGGLWWSTDETYKNAIPNELFLLDAVRLHQRTPGDAGPGSYFYWATNEWDWFKSSGMMNNQNLINDGLTSNCLNNGQTTWTYNQGVILGGLTELYKVTSDTSYLAAAEAIANAAIAHLTSAGGVLVEPCNCSGGDVPEFKGIFARNLACLYDEDHKAAYFNFLFTNSQSIWFDDRNSSNQLGMLWNGPFDSADAARQSSAIIPLGVIAEPVTALLPFAKGSGDPAFNHAGGARAGALGWVCSSNTPAGLMQSGPYLESLPIGVHTVHFRMAVNALNPDASNLVSLVVTSNGALAAANVAWNAFAGTNQFQDFPLVFTNVGGNLEFRVVWNQIPGAPTLTVSDVTVDGAHNWLAANLTHDIGRLDGNNAWEADPVRDTASGYLARGPGTTELGAANYDAQFELKVDNFNWDASTVATLSIVNTDTGQLVASRNIARSEFPNALYHSFGLYFQAVAGARYDFRTYWNYATNAPRLTVRGVVVTPAAGAGFAPIRVTAASYNEDMVIEHTAPPAPNGAHTTASMDAGAANTGNSWYEQGYDTAAPATGLPPAGSTITNLAGSDHVYTFPPSYTANNAAMVDSSHSATLVPVGSNAFSALSFLCAAGHGPVTVEYQVGHADGSPETGNFSLPDWFFNVPIVFDAEGRVDVDSGAFNNVNNNEPRLYAEDITLTNLAGAVTNISLTWDTGNAAGSVAAIFAVSGVAVQPVSIAISSSGQPAILTWPFGRLLQATNVSGPWFAPPAAASPYFVTPSGTSEFFRVQVQ